MAKYLVTSALPYANGPIHFGHVAGAYLPADVHVRYLRMAGHEVLYVCGTDEHGVAITLKAEQEGLGYREYVDRWHREIKEFFDRFRIEFDVWSGTARCPHHAALTQRFFSVLLERGLVFDRTEEQWYSEASQRFLPDRYLQGRCPECGFEKARGDECPKCGTWIDARKLGDPISLVDGSRPVLRPTKHWYLDLPKIRELGLGEWYETKRLAGEWKPNVDGYVQAMFKDLKPRPITRDLPWGVPLPAGIEGAEGKVLYVWFDAPIGYVSATAEWAERVHGDPEKWRDWWQDPATRLVHFIGKDNIAFHVVVFPAMLFGQGDAWEGRKFVLPSAVPANEFYNLQGKKFSTSSGWYLDNAEFFAAYDPDAARFHLMLSCPETADSEFTWQEFANTNNSLLADKIGNFASRVLKFAQRACAGRVPATAGTPAAHPQLAEADAAFGAVGGHLERCEFRKAAQSLVAGASALNQYFDALAPWKLAKSAAPADAAALAECVERSIAYLELLSRRINPICPRAAGELRAMLGAAAAPEGLSIWGQEGADQPPARSPAGAQLGEPGILFKKIEDEQVAAEVAKLLARGA
jgi:methionyl-tRNA synthetase